ncbi:MAG: type III restriction-modification system endonuclease [Candidatus Izemoplasmatales bacterium]
MKFRFKTQQYQVDAVNAIVDVFKGQPLIGFEEYTRDLGVSNQPKERQISMFDSDGNTPSLLDDTDDIGYSNASIKISDEKLLSNIRDIQTKTNLMESRQLINSLGTVSLDVEMETGTGKTYVYTRTIFELNKRYGWSKFIVVVPSIAIREGVHKSLEQTQEHFMDLYGKKIRFFIYNSSNLGLVDQFSKDSSINVMIINIQAFNTRAKATRIIYEVQDDFNTRRPIDVIAKNRPILILDEPQKMGGDATQESLYNFNPLFAINYSATHRIQHNLVHVLDALDAYNQKLVKKIEVKGFQIKNLRGTNGYLYLQKIAVSTNKPPRALIEIEIDYNKSINRETRWFDVGDNLYNTSKNMNQYQNGFTVSEINPINNTVTFLNGDVLSVGNSTGDVAENDIRRIQIRETILSHFDKEEELFERGIKVLSLFFIDEVAKYREYDEDGNQTLGIYGRIFEEEYIKAFNARGLLLDTPYDKYLKSIEPSSTHNGYFSIDKKGRSIDSPVKRNSDESDDISAYDLILKDKERLLSFEEPTRFIFSHSALREGWDNPNVFQICTLKYSANDVQRHQEVGRGLRICVNKDGERMDSTIPNLRFHQINKLTVIANESYDDFVRGLQSQIRENLFDRPTSLNEAYFVNKSIKTNGNDSVVSVSTNQARQIYFYLVSNQYVDMDGKVTDNYKNDIENNTLKPLPEALQHISNGIHTLVQRVYDNSVGMDIENANATKVETNSLNDNFYKQEFKELWNCINHKYAYTVQFDSDELIKNAVLAIDQELSVTRLIYTVATGEQKNDMEREDIDKGQSFKVAKTRSDTINSFASDSIEYDLIGKIREKTQLTRKSVAEILKRINHVKFMMFKINPEEFIKKVSNIINEQKSTMIVQHVTYNKTQEAPFDSEIFTQEKSKAEFIKAFKSKKNVQDYVFEDSKGERKFAEELDNADEVVVYAKLPKGFYIPTPVGNYSPDWAISFKKEAVKHVYFIAETKGSLDNLQLRKIESAKIECAAKLFESMSNSNVKYGKVTKYEDLLSLIKE